MSPERVRNHFIDRFSHVNHLANQRPVLLFTLFMLVIYYLLGYFRMLNWPPQSVHFVRQTDSLAFYLNYYLFDLPFFQPTVFDLSGENGAAASEFPLIYYLSAQLAKIFGPEPWILRTINLAILSAGITCFFALSYRFLQKFWIAFAATWLIFGTRLLVYYGNNFIPDTPSLGLVLCGWYCFYLFLQKGKWKHWWLYTGLFSLSGLIKVTMLVSALAVPVVILLFVKRGEFPLHKSKSRLLFNTSISTVIAVVITFAWYYYARLYNSSHGNPVFLTDAAPIWSLSREQIETVFDYMRNYWGPSYFHPNSWTLMFLLLAFSTWTFRKGINAISGSWLVIGAGCLAVLLFFFRQHQDHDYYFIAFIPFFAFLVLGAFYQLRTWYPRIFNAPFLSVFLSVYVIYTLNYARNKVQERYAQPDEFTREAHVVKGYFHVLDSLGVPPDARLLVPGDETGDGSLYFLRRKGLTEHETGEEKVPYLLEQISDKKLDYVVALNGTEPQGLQPYLEVLMDNDSVRVYRVRKEKQKE